MLNGKNTVMIKEYNNNYETKADFKNETGGTLNFPKKTGLTTLKSNIDKLDIDKLKNVPIGLSSSKSKVDKLDFGKLETTLVGLCKLNNT